MSDLTAAHLQALDWLEAGNPSRTYNCGYGKGYSVREVLDAMEAAAGRKLDVRFGPRRPSDPPALIADPSRIMWELEWRPLHADLETIVTTALAWERKENERRRLSA